MVLLTIFFNYWADST